jgi:hypothetical protein
MGLVHREIERICQMISSRETLIQFVTLPEELPVTETLEFQTKLLEQSTFHFAPILVNQCLPDFPGIPPLETKASEGVEPKLGLLLKKYFSLKNQETEALFTLEKRGLTFKKIPKLSNPEWLTTVEAISKELERL